MQNLFTGSKHTKFTGGLRQGGLVPQACDWVRNGAWEGKVLNQALREISRMIHPILK